jgi:hypothetical protein
MAAGATDASAAADTVWWRTDGGTVTGHRDESGLTCTLTLTSPDGRIAFSWGGGLPRRVTAESDACHQEPERISQVALEIGGNWMAGGNGTPNITALTGPSGFMFVLNDPVESQLPDAREVTVVTPGDRLSIGMPAGRTKALLAGLDKCRNLIS